ncbi:MAG: hypothetical protein ACK528_08305, partial [Alphaproteobacteria bacterium]
DPLVVGGGEVVEPLGVVGAIGAGPHLDLRGEGHREQSLAGPPAGVKLAGVVGVDGEGLEVLDHGRRLCRWPSSG